MITCSQHQPKKQQNTNTNKIKAAAAAAEKTKLQQRHPSKCQTVFNPRAVFGDAPFRYIGGVGGGGSWLLCGVIVLETRSSDNVHRLRP